MRVSEAAVMLTQGPAAEGNLQAEGRMGVPTNGRKRAEEQRRSTAQWDSTTGD